jgi:lipopolysaccharide heptosyltransferase II
MADTIHRTLIIRFSSVGDIILSSLLVRLLRRRFPSATIDYLVKEEYAPLLQGNPHLSHLLMLPREGSLSSLRSVRHSVQQGSYDLLIDLHNSLRSRFVTFGHPRVVRINKRKLARFLLVKMKWNLYDRLGGSPSIPHRYLETVQHLGLVDDGAGLEVFVPEEATVRIGALLAEAGVQPAQPLIGVCPSARHNNKMWIKEKFADAASGLAQSLKAGILLFGSGAEEQKRCAEVAALIAQKSPSIHTVNCADRLTLQETAAAMDRCSLVITNDTGLMHLAAARKRKVIAIFGPTVRELGFFPFGTQATVLETPGLACRPCTHVGLAYCPKGHFRCMNEIDAQRVINAGQALLRETSPS